MAEINPLYTDFKEQQTSPATPASGTVIMYIKYNKHIYTKDSSGVERDITSSITALSSLTDVTITSPSNGQYLKYNNGTWINSNVPSNISAMDGLTDVDTSSVSSNYAYTIIGTTYRPKKNLSAALTSNLSVGQTIVDSATTDDQMLLVDGSNCTTKGDSQLIATSQYFKYFDDGELVDFGPYVLCGFMKLTLASGSGNVNIRPYMTDGSGGNVEVADQTNTSPIATLTLTSGTDTYWSGFYAFKPDAGYPQYTFAVDNTAGDDVTVYYRMCWYKLGHTNFVF